MKRTVKITMKATRRASRRVAFTMRFTAGFTVNREVRSADPSGGGRRADVYRYWPVFGTVSIVRPGSLPCLPWMIVRM